MVAVPGLMDKVIAPTRLTSYAPAKVAPATAAIFKPQIATQVIAPSSPVFLTQSQADANAKMVNDYWTSPAYLASDAAKAKAKPVDVPAQTVTPGIVKKSNPNDMGIWSVVGGAIGSIIEPGGGTAIGGAIGSVIDAESASGGGSAGYDAYIAKPGRVGPWPDVTTLINALTAAGDKDTNLLNAIKATYNQKTGTATYGDWKIAVISTQPIAIEQFKGPTQTGITRTTANLATFAAGAAGGTQIAQSNISAGPATNAVFGVGQAATGTGASQSNMNAPGSNTPVWMWPVIGVVGFILTIVTLFVALKPSRR